MHAKGLQLPCKDARKKKSVLATHLAQEPGDGKVVSEAAHGMTRFTAKVQMPLRAEDH